MKESGLYYTYIHSIVIGTDSGTRIAQIFDEIVRDSYRFGLL